MKQQRQQAYLTLIQQLLSCPDKEEGEILAANQDLIHAPFCRRVGWVTVRLSSTYPPHHKVVFARSANTTL